MFALAYLLRRKRVSSLCWNRDLSLPSLTMLPLALPVYLLHNQHTHTHTQAQRACSTVQQRQLGVSTRQTSEAHMRSSSSWCECSLTLTLNQSALWAEMSGAERKRLNAMRMQQADWRNLLPSAAKADDDAVKLKFCPQTSSSVAPSNSHTVCTCIHIYVGMCVCRLQVFTISGAWRRLYFGIRGSTNIRTHASMRLFARVYVHLYIVAEGGKAKKAAHRHTHTRKTLPAYTYIHSHAR